MASLSLHEFAHTIKADMLNFNRVNLTAGAPKEQHTTSRKLYYSSIDFAFFFKVQLRNDGSRFFGERD